MIRQCEECGNWIASEADQPCHENVRRDVYGFPEPFLCGPLGRSIEDVTVALAAERAAREKAERERDEAQRKLAERDEQIAALQQQFAALEPVLAEIRGAAYNPAITLISREVVKDWWLRAARAKGVLP
ncbi:MAG: hypothetical protein HY825_13500 [Acidobacteria bacterium]|nr:hypothetical protein [Acidobacteriota bacterium]